MKVQFKGSQVDNVMFSIILRILSKTLTSETSETLNWNSL